MFNKNSSKDKKTLNDDKEPTKTENDQDPLRGGESEDHNHLEDDHNHLGDQNKDDNMLFYKNYISSDWSDSITWADEYEKRFRIAFFSSNNPSYHKNKTEYYSVYLRRKSHF